MNKTVVYKRAETSEELQQILNIQQRNIKQALSNSVIQNEGFVSVEHTLDTLQRMNDVCPHIIAKSKGDVIAYALCLFNASRNDVPTLKPMFNHIDKVIKSKNLINLKYLIMGQICIDKSYRKQGVFKNLYRFFKQELISEFDAVITEVNLKNKRSLNAHMAVGFKTLASHIEEGEYWKLIIWEWRT